MEKDQHHKGRKYLRKREVAARYGDIDVRSVDRMKLDGRIPPPKYLPGSRIPIWAEDELDANDRKATLTPRHVSKRKRATASA